MAFFTRRTRHINCVLHRDSYRVLSGLLRKTIASRR
ncbi:hypothetical protein [Caudoviricetes sp.]|nr:hypothetical protein [Caudoviricetes sp.]